MPREGRGIDGGQSFPTVSAKLEVLGEGVSVRPRSRVSATAGMPQPYTVHTQCIHSASILTISLNQIG